MIIRLEFSCHMTPNYLSSSLFIDETRLTDKIKDHLKLTDENGILKIFPYTGLQEELRKLGQLEKKIWVILMFFFACFSTRGLGVIGNDLA